MVPAQSIQSILVSKDQAMLLYITILVLSIIIVFSIIVFCARTFKTGHQLLA